MVRETDTWASISRDNLLNSCGYDNLKNNVLGIRSKLMGYQYSEIIRNLTNTFLAGGDHIEDINNEQVSKMMCFRTAKNIKFWYG